EAASDDQSDTASEAPTTSTAEHEHEPFDTFKDKVAQLAVQLFPKHNTQDIRITRIRGGTFNRVVGITVTKRLRKLTSWKQFLCGLHNLLGEGRWISITEEQYILRIPRSEGHAMDFDVAILQFVGKHLDIPVPRIISYDLSTDNVIGQAYMLQPRLRGQNLSLIYSSLNTAQKKSIVPQVTQLVMTTAAVTSHAAGRPSRNQDLDNPQIEIEKFEVPRRGQDLCGLGKPSTWVADAQTPLDFILEQCERWREYQQVSNGNSIDRIWKGFRTIAHGLQELGFLEPDTFRLCHGDLQPYNLLVEVRDEENVDITAVLDWDSAVFAPSFLAYKAPFWAWLPEDCASDEEDDENYANFEPQTEEDKLMKDVFMQYARAEYIKYAFAPEAIIARKMFGAIKDCFFTSWEFDNAYAVIEGWKALHPSD
ncbi:uncharacterized protein EI97DRAFT_360783, partial [Westerdykella ornata]